MPIDVPCYTFDTVQVTNICNKQTEQDRPPDFEVRHGAKDYGFMNSSREEQVCQLGEYNLVRDWYGFLGRRAGTSELDIYSLGETGVHSWR